MKYPRINIREEHKVYMWEIIKLLKIKVKELKKMKIIPHSSMTYFKNSSSFQTNL